MKYLPFLAFAFLAGCETQDPSQHDYTKLVVTDPRGDLIAEWIAEGHVKKTEQGYEIHAVERHTAPPRSLSLQYPNGRDATVVGPNILLKEVEKPLWLQKLDDAKQ